MTCDGNACETVTPPGDCFKLAVTLDDGVFESNVFDRRGFDATYRIAIEDDHLFVRWEPSLGFFGYLDLLGFPVILILVIIVEGAVIRGVARALRVPAPRLVWIAIANSVSLSLVWFPLRLASLPTVPYVLLAESVAVALEAGFYRRTGRARGVTARQATGWSLLANAVTFLIGARFREVIAPIGIRLILGGLIPGL